MTRISRAHGHGGLYIDVPSDRSPVVEPSHTPAAPDQRLELMRAMRELAAAGSNARLCVLAVGPQTIPYLLGQGAGK